MNSEPELSRLSVNVDREHCPSPHTWRNKIGRVLWGCVWTLFFRPSPRICFGWRRVLLRMFHAHIGRQARISPSVRVWAPWNLHVGDETSLAHGVDCYAVGPLRIGNQTTVSQNAFLCGATHDVTDPHMRLLISTIEIGDQAWVCAGAMVLPGVRIGEGAVVGAGAVVTKDVAPWTIVAGNPARFIRDRVLAAPATALHTSEASAKHGAGR